MPIKRARRAAAPDPGPPADPAPAPRPPVTAGELRDAHTSLLRAEVAALEALEAILRECPHLPGASAWTLTAALDPERAQLARQLAARLGYDRAPAAAA